MKTFITQQETVQESIKSIGIFLWFIAGIMALRSIADPWLLIDVGILGLMAYFAHIKLSAKAVYFAAGYYVLDSLLWIDVLIQSPIALIVRGAIVYWIFKTAFKAYVANKNPELLAESA